MVPGFHIHQQDLALWKATDANYNSNAFAILTFVLIWCLFNSGFIKIAIWGIYTNYNNHVKIDYIWI